MAENTFELFQSPGGAQKEVVGPPISGATVAPSALIHHVDNTTAISTITPPWTEFGGVVYLVADSQFTVTTSGNVGAALSTTVAGTAYGFVYDKKTAKWYPVA